MTDHIEAINFWIYLFFFMVYLQRCGISFDNDRSYHTTFRV